MLEQIPLKKIYREIVYFHLKENFDNYVQAGWQTVEIHGDLDHVLRAKKDILTYRAGWLRGFGDPVYPILIEEVPPPRFQDLGSSEN